MEEKLENIKSIKTIDECEKIVNNLSPTTLITEEEEQNFLSVVTQVEKIVKKLASSDPQEQEHGKILADQMLGSRMQKEISENDELIVKSNKTVINKYSSSQEPSDPNKMSQEVFMKCIEKDAKQRAEDRKIRNERAETFRVIGNGAFKNGDYEKAVTYYTKAIEQRKDSSMLWNNRGLSYMRLKLYEKALLDFEWALKVNDTSLKALLNTALCYKHLRNELQWKEYIQTAKDRNPYYHKFIEDFEKSTEAASDTCVE